MAHVYRGLISEDGRPCGGLYGAVMFLRNFLVRYPHAMIIAAFDRGVPKFRTRYVPTYKKKRQENREKDPKLKAFYEDLKDQLKQIPELLQALGIHTAYCDGYEADDVIGACILRRYRTYPCTIFSEDKDLIQLVGEHCRQYRSCVKQMVETCPPYYLLRRAMEGDSSDSIPGVPGVGSVHAGRVLAACGCDDLDVFFAALDVTDKKQASVLEHAEQIRKTLKTTDLRRTARRVNRDMVLEKSSFDQNAFVRFCASYKFRNFLQSPSYYCKPFARAKLFIRGRHEKEKTIE